jgi:hypothetical protein
VIGGTYVSVPRPWAPRLAAALVVALVLATSALILFGNGAIELAFVPLAATVFLYAIWALPLRNTVLALFIVALVVDVPSERPASGHWKSPLYTVGAFIFDNLNNVTGISALRFSGLDVLILLLLGVMVARAARRGTGERIEGGANALTLFLAIQFIAVVALEVWGLARGGDFKQSLWQVRQMLWLPTLALLFSVVLKGGDEGWVIGKAVIWGACAKTVLGLYVLLAIVRPRGIDAPYVTTHSDSVLFAAAIAFCITTCMHRPSVRNLVRYGAAAAFVLLGIVANNRRIAFVALFAALWVIYAILPWGRVKRGIALVALALAPVFAMYLVAGRNRPHGVFAPAASIMSVVMQKDASSGTRDIENYNLVQTLKASPIVGSGLGHEYLELSQAHDISGAFQQYRYIGHNSILWLWSVAGLVGFTAVWMALVVCVYLARRSYYLARNDSERITASWVLAVVAIYLVQAWGDMGMHGWVVVMILAAALGLTGNLAVATGAWPAGARLTMGGRRPSAARPRPALGTLGDGA